MASNKDKLTRLRALKVAENALKSKIVTRQGVSLGGLGEYSAEELVAEAKIIEAYINS